MFIRFLAITLLLLAVSTAGAQSGRGKKKPEPEKDKPKKESRYNPTQDVTLTPTVDPTATPPPLPKNGGRDDIIIESTLVPIPVSVIDNANGRAVTDLGLADFTLRIDDRKVDVDELFRSETPVRLALLFDNSSSVTIAREFEQKAAVRFLQRVIRPDRDLAALYSIAGISKLEQPLTKDVSALIRAIKLFDKPQGATALHDGIVAASVYLRGQAGRRVIVIVSDGQDTLSDVAFDEMVRTVQENNCQVYIVHTNDFENYKRTGNRIGSANLRALAAERRMKNLAEETGGAVYSPIDEPELDQAFARISAELSQQYILGYYPESEVRDGRMRVINLTIRSDKSLTVRSRKGYYVSKRN